MYPELCTDKLLVMEFMPGVKISDVKTLEAKGFSRKVLARNLAKAYLYQFCKFGFFNTDPHPGNLAVRMELRREEWRVARVCDDEDVVT